MNIKGKKIKEVMNEDTIICNKDNLMDGWDNTVIGHINNAGTINDDTVLYDSYYVFIFNNKKLKTIFRVDEINSVIVNKKRNLMIIDGFEAIYQYWFDNGEFFENFTRNVFYI